MSEAAVNNTTGPRHRRSIEWGRFGQARFTLAAIWRQVRRDARVFAQSPLAVIGVVLVVLFGVMALIHPLLMATIWPRGIYHPEVGFDINVMPWPAPPAPGHPLGVDSQGRDILSMLLAATRPTFFVALTAAATTALVSLTLGVLTSYFGGWLDRALSAISDALLLMPAPLVMVIVGSQYYEQITTVGFGVLYGVLSGASSAAIVLRSHGLTLMQRPFIDAARVAGAGPWRIITHHLIPHMLPLVAVHMMLSVVGVVVADGFFAFFGLRGGLRLNWGTMTYNTIYFRSINPDIPWVAVLAPTVCLSLFAAAFYFIARGLQNIADPRLHQR